MSTPTTINGINFYRVKSDINGNPRYAVHFLDFITECAIQLRFEQKYRLAKANAKKCGFREYRGADFGGGFVISSYNLEDVATDINNLKNNQLNSTQLIK